MDKDTALTKLEPLPQIDGSALPQYYTLELAARQKIRSGAYAEAVSDGLGGTFFTLVALFSAALSGTIWGHAGPVLLALISAALSGVTGIIGAKSLWRSGERITFLRGTRDETKYLPACCRAHAAEEATLFIAAAECQQAIGKWNASLAMLEEHGTPRLRSLALAGRERLEARRAKIAQESARLWALAASSETPKALPGAVAVKALPPAPDWATVEEIDLAEPADS